MINRLRCWFTGHEWISTRLWEPPHGLVYRPKWCRVCATDCTTGVQSE